MKRVLLLVIAVLCLWACEKTPEEIAVTSVSLNQPTADMIIGETVQLKVSISPSNATDKNVIWGSSKQSVATVSDNGLVTAIAEGTSTVTASVGGKSSTCIVTVSKKVIEVSSVKLNKESLELVEGDSETLIATVLPENATDKTVTWESSDPSVASVDQNGTVTAVAEGQAGITAMIGDKGSFCKVVVSKKVIAVESIELNKTELTIYEGETETLIASVKPDDATDKTVQWESSNKDIATVDGNGNVTGIKEGEASIIARAGDKSTSCKVVVAKRIIAVESIELSKTTLELFEGESEVLTAKVLPDNATDKTVTWSSSDASIATVEEGKVIAIKEGEATITASAGGTSASCSVTVKRKEVTPEAVDLGLSVKWASFNVGANSPEEYGNYYAWGETSPKSNYSWESYKFWVSGDNWSNWKFSKYNTKSNYGTIDNKTQLDLSDDAARVNWGGSWRMPTKAEWQELQDNCTWTWTTQSGKYGYKVTGPSGNSIFLPSAGYWMDSSSYYVGSYGDYWSSSLCTDEPNRAWIMLFQYEYYYHKVRSNGGRNAGLPVRPVTE